MDNQIENTEPQTEQTQEQPTQKKTGHSCCGTCAVRGGKLHTYDWLEDLPTPPNASDLVEVQFKNTRKAYFRNSTGIALKKGDIVAVESSPGHDIGEVTLLGRLVYLQMHKNNINPTTYEFKRIYRIARPTDLDKWNEAMALEQPTMLEARQIAEQLHLNMKIGDVEYQGDRTKAIFYYIADERVDFRELIKVLADRFHVRIEMRQIGARQEAGRIGGIGPCGRELCCATWMTNFISVTTHSARVQELSLNPLKLAGQCGKLKCCLNYELDVYLDAIKSFPPTDKKLETEEGTYYFFKYDIFKHIMWYSLEKDTPSNITAVDAEHVREIQEMNERGEKPDKLGGIEQSEVTEELSYSGVVELDDLTRFDNKNKNNRKSQGRGANKNSSRREQDGNRNKANNANQLTPRLSTNAAQQRTDTRTQKTETRPTKENEQQQPTQDRQQRPLREQRQQTANGNRREQRNGRRGNHFNNQDRRNRDHSANDQRHDDGQQKQQQTPDQTDSKQ